MLTLSYCEEVASRGILGRMTYDRLAFSSPVR